MLMGSACAFALAFYQFPGVLDYLFRKVHTAPPKKNSSSSFEIALYDPPNLGTPQFLHAKKIPLNLPLKSATK
jgi:hypothetical protein